MSQKINFMLTMLLVLLFAGAGFAEIKTQQPRYGNGTKDAPFKITSVAELYWLAEVVNGGKCSEYGGGNCSAELTTVLTVNSNLLGENNANVNAETGEYTGNAPANVWTPIGTNDNEYTGTFDGNGKIVRGLYFNDGTKDYVGLFGFTGTGATVQNVGVVDSYFKGKQYVGGVVGYNNGGTISNAYNTGFVSGTQKVGGVVGQNDGTISNVYNTGSVSGEYNVGGVVGRNNGVTISNAYNTGSVSGNDYVGGVVGDNGGPISNAYNTGSVSGNGYVGGVVGYLYKGMFGAIIWDGSISNVYNTGSVSGTDGCVGGVAGSSVNGTVSNAYNTGSVSGVYYVGGVAGSVNGTVSNAYNTGSVSGTRDCVGGVVGFNYDGTISNVYNTGSVSGTGDYVGGVVGKKDNGDINNAYYDEQTCNNCNSYGTGKPLAELASLKIGSKADNDADFPLLEGEEESPWAKGIYYDKATGKLANSNLPYLKSLPKPQDVEMEFNVKDNVIQISSTDDLKNFAKLVNEYHITDVDAELTTNLTVNSNLLGENNANVNAKTGEYKGSAPANVWTPIGTKDNQYTGTFDGKGNTVSGLYFNDKSKDYVGLFGYISSGATVQNVGVVDSYFKGKQYVGGVVGDNDGGAIINVYNAGSVSGAGGGLGGVVGINLGSISNAYNTGSVSGISYVGGVVGDNENGGKISNVYNTGSVSGTYDVGGVVGINNWGSISNAYNTGSVSGTYDVGGVVGDNKGTIGNVYNTGSVSGISYVGGVVGINLGSISNVYNTGSVSGTYGVGGVVGGNNGGDINKAYYDNQTCNNCNSYGTGKPLAELASLKIGSKADNDADFPLLEGEKESPWAKGIYYDKATGKLANSNLPYLKSLPKPQDVEMEFNVKDNVIQISSTDDLKNFAKLVNEYHITDVDAELTTNLTVNSNLLGENNANVDADGLFDVDAYKTANSSAPESWTPIGTSSANKYTGTFDGNGHTIRGLYFNDRIKDYVGLFGHIGSGATVQNVGVIDSYLRGSDFVGGVVGLNDGSIINVYNAGSVSGNDYVGGVVGDNSGPISNAYNTGSVSGANDVGGVVGINNWGSISNVYNTGSVSGANDVGGVVGRNLGSTISNAYNTGSVSGANDVGGVVGYNDGTIGNVYNTGSVNGTGDYVGGVVGKKRNDDITNAYYNTDVACEKCNSTVGVGKTTFELASAMPTDLGFGENVWTAEGVGTPEVNNGKLIYILPGLKNLGGPVKFAVLAPNGDGVYEISSAQQLRWFAQLVNNVKPDANAILKADITFNDGSVYDGEGELKSNLESWTPIGTSVKAYTGTFDGNGKTVSGLYFNDKSKDYVGLFGVTTRATVQNVGVIDSYIRGGYYVGGVVGQNSGTISNVYNTGSVSGEDYVGGVVGQLFSGTISNAYNTGMVSGYDYEGGAVGGVVGYNYGGTISNAYNAGSVSGTGDYVGGVVGINRRSISNVYNTGSVSGSSKVGGVVGDNENGGKISNVYNTGSVSKTTGSGGKYFGSVVGGNFGSLTNTYYKKETSSFKAVGAENGTGSDVEGSAGKTTFELAGATLETLGFDDQVWEKGGVSYEKSTGKLTLSYPYLKKFSDAPHKETIQFFTLKNNVIQIKDSTDLKNFAKLVNEYGVTRADAELTGNICLNACEEGDEPLLTQIEALKKEGKLEENSFEQWTPIGTSLNNAYMGKFDGKGNTVSGLYINDEMSYVGLFGVTTGATVQNVGVIDSYIRGGDYVGGVVGRNAVTIICNVYNTGTVVGAASVGGVVGQHFSGTISNAYNLGMVSGYDYEGGGVGGVVGANRSSISNVYNTGSVSVTGDYVGGVVGYNFGGTISNVYNTGSVSGTGDYVGGVVGKKDNGDINKAYYDEQTCNNCNSYGTGKPLAELATLTIGSKADADADFPLLDGEEESPWVSGSAEATKESESDENYVVAVKLPKLKGFDYQPTYKGTFSIKVKDKDYATPELTTDDIESISLTFGGKTYNDKNDNLVLFENNDPDNFSTARGSYYGVNFSVELLVFAPIDGIYVIEDAKHLKMFAKVIARDPNANGILANDIVFNDGSVYDVEGKLKESLESWTPMGTTEKPFTGRFNAVEDGGAAHTISGMYFNNAEKDSVGLFKKIGAAGSVANVGIVKSYIKGNNYVGAIAGLNEGSISASFNSSTVEGGSNVGGVAGGNAGEISNVYNAGPVSGASEVGGVVGNNGGSVNDVYSIGAVSGTGSKVGGAIGGNVGGTISGVYYDMDMPCTNCSDVAGVSGKYSAELADYGFVNSAFSNASSVWSAGSFMNNNGKLSFKLPYLTGFGAGTQPTFTGSFAVSAKNKSVYKSKNFTAGDIYSASFSVGTESFKNDAEGFVFSSLNDLTESGMVDGTYHGVNFSLLMDPIIVVDGDKATIHGDSKQTLNIAEEDGFTINGTVTVKRNFTANGYSTVMFPFSMKASSISGAAFYELSNVAMVEGKWRVSVSEVKDTETEVGMVKANTPYLVKTANASELVLDEGEYKFESTKGVLHSVESNGWNLVGTYGYKKWEEGDDGIGKTYGFAGAKDNSTVQIGKFGKIGAGAYIYPMRVYLEKKAASGVRFANGGKALDAIATLPESIDIVVDGGADKGTTVIGTLNSRTGEFKAANDGYFDTKGRSVGKKPAAKGSYYNKKKAVAK